MPESVIVDTGFFVALANTKDTYHTDALQLSDYYADHEWVTTWPVITEVCHLVSSKAQKNLLKQYSAGKFIICDLEFGDMPRLTSLIQKYEKEEIDLADLSLILVAENLGHGNILTCGRRDFSFLRWGRNKPFINLFFLQIW